MKKVILFDFFGVISCEIAPFWLRKFYGEDELAEVKLGFTDPADSGEISERELFCNISRATGVAPEDIREQWLGMVRINGELVEYIKGLRKGHRVYLLSNATSEFLHGILKDNGLYELFDGLFISSEVHLIKPHREFFDAALERFKIAAEDAVMIDDNPRNIAGAKEAGIQGIVYTDNEALFKALEEI